MQLEMSVSILAGSHKSCFCLNFMAMAEVLERASANAQVHFTPLLVSCLLTSHWPKEVTRLGSVSRDRAGDLPIGGGCCKGSGK